MKEITNSQKPPTKLIHQKMYRLRPIVITKLAHYESPSAIVKEMQERYGVRFNKDSITQYQYSVKWAQQFNDERKKFLSELSNVPASQKIVRLTRAEQLYEEAKSGGDNKECRALLEYMRTEMAEVKEGMNLTMNQYNILSDKEISEKIRRIKSRIAHMVDKEESINADGAVS